MPRNSEETNHRIKEPILHISLAYLRNKPLHTELVVSHALNFFSAATLDSQFASAVLQHVVYGEEKEAERLIAIRPSCLLSKASAVDYSFRQIIATPFQGALGAEDERMWQMMMPYFKFIPVLLSQASTRGVSIEEVVRQEMLQQFKAQFPSGIKDTPAAELLPLYHQLALDINIAQDNGAKAIEVFKIEMTGNKVIQFGKHFNMQHFVAVHQAYIQYYSLLDTRGKLQAFRSIIQFIQMQIPANHAQAHCSAIDLQTNVSGLEKVLDQPSLFKRTLFVTTRQKFYPQTSARRHKVFDTVFQHRNLMAQYFGAKVKDSLGRWLPIVRPNLIVFAQFNEKKEKELARLLCQLQQPIEENENKYCCRLM